MIRVGQAEVMRCGTGSRLDCHEAVRGVAGRGRLQMLVRLVGLLHGHEGDAHIFLSVMSCALYS